MKIKFDHIILGAGIWIIFLLSSCQNDQKKVAKLEEYKPRWESLSLHNESPDWFTEAKFGIYFHWGVYSVPAYHNEWYPRWMHFDGHPVNEYHVEHYGDPSEFSYHDFVPLFSAEKFDAEEWVSLFKNAGAKFAGPVAEHHDGFSMWDSKITPWNSMDKGPGRDILGELKKAMNEKNLRLITTFHHARNLQRYWGQVNEEMKKDNIRSRFRNSHYPLFPKAPPADTTDIEFNYIYGNFPEEEWLEEIWLGKLIEVYEKYEPDIIWFDSWLDRIPEIYRQRFCAGYLNHAEALGKEVVIVRKQEDLPLEVSVDDLEKSRKNEIGDKVWMTDETISRGSWCYTEGLEIKEAKDVLHVLIDVVSKNGILLLNISPKADGTIPQNQQEVLLKIGKWLNDNGEAIYKTQPWYTYGEGPVKEPEGHFKNARQFQNIKYSEKDIRYTCRDNVLYAIFLGTPEKGSKVLLESFEKGLLPKNFTIDNIKLLENNKELNFQLKTKGLEVFIPEELEENMAAVLRIEL